jgi:hypothetical protein
LARGWRDEQERRGGGEHRADAGGEGEQFRFSAAVPK